MQFLKITDNLTLPQLIDTVGSRNVDSILNLNMLRRSPDIGKQFKSLSQKTISENNPISYQRKKTILNTLTSEADVFETACLQTEEDWKILDTIGTIANTLRIPESLKIPDSVYVIGGTGEPIDRNIYNKAITYLDHDTDVDPIIFNTYNLRKSSQIIDTQDSVGIASDDNPINWFNLPWGKISLYSSLSRTSVDFPVYPDGFENETTAVYETMPDMLYQYEPWQVYKSSGPRTNTYEFDMHRDMWTGDHRDGKCNELIRFCEANCYARYSGASVQTAAVTLYLSGEKLITGILTDVKVSWDNDSPIGYDGMRLHLRLSITITEVSEGILTYDTVKNRGLIG